MPENLDFFCSNFLLKQLPDEYIYCEREQSAFRIVSFSKDAFMENKVKLCGNNGDSANSSNRYFLSSFLPMLSVINQIGAQEIQGEKEHIAFDCC